MLAISKGLFVFGESVPYIFGFSCASDAVCVMTSRRGARHYRELDENHI